MRFDLIGEAGRRRVARGLALGVVALALAGCGARTADTSLELAPRISGAKLVPVYVATTRTPVAGSKVAFNAGRSQTVSYARYLVSVPPGHKDGEVESSSGAPDPAKSFAIVEAAPLDEDTFFAEVRTKSATAPRKHTVGVFIHGFNYTFEESLFRRAQLAADANVAGAPVLFAWASAASPTAYVADRDAAAVARDGYAHLIARLTADPKANVLNFCHSMGCLLVMEGLRQLRLTGQGRVLDRLGDVALAAPDIDVDLFLKQLSVVGRLDPPLTVLVSKDDGALALSSALAGGRRRVGAADIENPRVQQGARDFDVRVIDISELEGTGGASHDRYAAMAALYPKLRRDLESRGNVFTKAGAFLLNASTGKIAPAAPAR